jgi:hypothetical protein
MILYVHALVQEMGAVYQRLILVPYPLQGSERAATGTGVVHQPFLCLQIDNLLKLASSIRQDCGVSAGQPE